MVRIGLKLIALALAFWATIQPALAAAEPAAEAGLAKARLAVDFEGGELAIGALDDPANPYYGQYSDYDRWLYEHYLPLSLEEYNALWTPEGKRAAQYPADWTFQPGSVNPKGWQIPRRLQSPLLSAEYETIGDLWATDPLAARASRARSFSFFAGGVLDPALARQGELEQSAELAERFPPVPAWLGEQPPLQTVFVPNGDILCYGELGLKIEVEPGRYDSWFPAGEIWYRYDRQGRLLGQYDLKLRDNHNGWLELYAPGRQERAARENPGLHSFSSSHGYLAVSKGSFQYMSGAKEKTEADTPVAVYDYDGTRVDPALPLPADRRYGLQATGSQQLHDLYENQLQSGRTSSASTSPYEGSAEGPVRAAGVTRKARKMAFGQAGFKVIGVEVRPLDDPANPYRERYGAVDRWLYEHNGVSYPRHRNMPELRPDQHVIQLSGEVDSAGYLVPLRERNGWLQMALPAGDLREPQRYDNARPRMWCETELDAATWQDWCQCCWEGGIKEMPRIPQWLIDRRPPTCVFLPDGAVLVNLPAENAVLDPNQPGGPLVIPMTGEWTLFAADGTLLRSTGNTGPYWQSAFDPEFEQRMKAAGPQGLEFVSNGGYLTTFKAEGRQPVLAYDYTGAPLDASMPLTRQRGVCVLLQWRDLSALYAIQQQMLVTPVTD